MFDYRLRVLLSTALYAFVGLVHATEVKVEFSAEAIQMAPQRPVMQAKMYVSKKAVRTETNSNNQQFVEIVFPKEGRRIMLMPQLKTYVEQRGMPINMPAVPKQKNFNPCTGVPDTTCKKLATEKLQGRTTEKWQITTQAKGRPMQSLHWIDVKRRLPLRESFADGSKSELKIVNKETINGRKTEKWQLTVTRSDGQRSQSSQWYDPQLEMVIREEFPGGYVRELRNIKVAKQPKQLFSIPADFRLQQAPPGMASGISAPANR